MSVRERNKERRRQQILDAARRMLAEGGYRALNMRALAREAEVTQPTLYNLIGNKEQILFQLASRMMDVLEARSPTAVSIDAQNPTGFIDAGITVSADLFAEEPGFYRSAFLAATFADNQELFWSHDSEFLKRAVAVPTRGCQALADAGLLEGRFSAESLGQHIFQGFRAAAIRDWATGVITLEEYRVWILRCSYAALVLDAKQPLRQMLLERLIVLYADP